MPAVDTLCGQGVEPAIVADASQPRRECIHSIEGIFRIGGVPASGARLDVIGVKDGAPCTFSFGAAETMGKITGIPAALCALAAGRLPKGAYAPEGCLDPEPFLAELAERGITYQRM